LRTLTDRGQLEKRELPGGQPGYTLATAPTGASEPPAPAATTSEPRPTATPTPARGDQPDEDDTTAPRGADITRRPDAPIQPGQAPTNEPEG
jgi:hypothetical protein